MADYGIGQGLSQGIQQGMGIANTFATYDQQRQAREQQQEQLGLAKKADVRAEQSHGIAMQTGLLELKKLKANAEMVNVDNLINLFPDQRDQSIAKRLIAPYRSPENQSEVRSEDIRAAYKDLRDPTKQAGFLTWKLQDIASDKEKVLADYTTKKGSMEPWEATDENMQALDKQKSDAIAKLDDEERRLKSTSPQWKESEKNKEYDDFKTGYKAKNPNATSDEIVAAFKKSGQADATSKAPTVHSFIEGDKHIDKQWDPEKKEWIPVSSGPRYKPSLGVEGEFEKRFPEYTKLPDGIKKRIDGMVEDVHDGSMEPAAVEKASRTLGVNIQGAFQDRYREKYGSYDQTKLQANATWYKNPRTQQYVRRAKSALTAMDEDMRLARLVDNPSVMKVNQLTGYAKKQLSQSQRHMLDMGNLFTADELNQILGGAGGAVEYFKTLRETLNTNMSVQAYTDILREAQVYLAARVEEYLVGTPGMKDFKPILEKIRANKPFAGQGEAKPEVSHTIQGIDWNALDVELAKRKQPVPTGAK